MGESLSLNIESSKTLNSLLTESWRSGVIKFFLKLKTFFDGELIGVFGEVASLREENSSQSSKTDGLLCAFAAVIFGDFKLSLGEGFGQEMVFKN